MCLRFCSIVFFLLFLSACGSHKEVVYYPACKIKPLPHNAPRLDTGTKARYLSAVNQMRAEPRRCGGKIYRAAQPLQWSDKLYRAAYEHSKDMAACCYFSHSGSGKTSDWTAKVQQLGKCSSFVNRIENNGYTKYRGVAENIAYGSYTFDKVMQQWIHSEGHCANIMNPKFTEFGMAKVKSADGRYYWTQNFGAGR